MDYVTRHEVDVILSDFGLPDAIGQEAVTSLRAAAPSVPLIIMTGQDDTNTATQALRKGLAVVLDEDAEALRLQEIGLRSRPPGERDALIAQDAGVAKARRLMEQLLAAETT